MAQTTPAASSAGASGDSDAQEVVVVGIRKSLQKSLQVKRKSSAQMDVITAEDVSKFPDTNVAEALSRVPGVTIDHSGGEGNKVSILGIDSRLINVSLNGNPLATSTGGIATADTGRSFNFSNLAPELIGNVQVYKSTQAKLDEGNVGGSIIVNSRKPLDLPANTLSLSLNYNKNLRTESSEPRASLFYSWRNSNRNLGFLGTIAYNKLELGGTSISVLSGYETACKVPGWGGCNAAGTAFTDPSKLPTVSSGPALTPGALVPVNLNSGSFISQAERMTYQGTVQWRPTDNLEFNLSGYYVDADDSSYSQAMLTNLGAGYDDGVAYDSRNADNSLKYPITYTSVTTNENGVTGGKMTNVATRLDMQYNKQQLTTKSLNLQGRWTPGQWTIEGNIGDTKATGGADPQYFLSFYGNTSAEWSLSQDSSYLKTGTPLTDGSLFKSRVGETPVLNPDGSPKLENGKPVVRPGQQAGFVKVAATVDEIKYAKLDFKRDVEYGWVNQFEFGFKYSEHSNSDDSHFYNTNVKTSGSVADLGAITTNKSLVKGLGASGDLLSYAYLSQEAMVAYSVANRSPGFSADSTTGDYNNTGAEWNVVEKDAAAYLQANFRAGKFHGDAGVRVVNTDSAQTYFSSQNYYPYIGEFKTSKNEYTDILPSMNVIYDLDETQDLRFTVGKVMARPSFAETAGQVTYNIVQRVGGGGNPNLGPYRSTNWGASYENYFAPNSIFSVDVFLRDIEQYTIYRDVLTSIVIPQATVDYCNIPVPSTNGGTPACPGVTSPVNILMTTPYNGSNAKVTGVSLSYQGDIKWGFGIQANATWLNQEYGSFNESTTVTGFDSNGDPVPTTRVNADGKYPLPYLSKWSYTIAPYYEKGPLSAHLSYTWRSSYNVTSGGRSGDTTRPPSYTSSYGQLDGSVSYDINSRLQLTASATNILDPLVKPYTTGNLPLGWSKYGARVIVGLTYKLN